MAAGERQLVLALAGVGDRSLRPAKVMRQVAQAAEDVRGELAVPPGHGHARRPLEVLPGKAVVSAVVSHPAGHLREAGGSREDPFPVAVESLAEHARRDRPLQIAHHRRVQVCAADLAVRNAERAHHVEVVTGRCRRGRPMRCLVHERRCWGKLPGWWRREKIGEFLNGDLEHGGESGPVPGLRLRLGAFPAHDGRAVHAHFLGQALLAQADRLAAVRQPARQHHHDSHAHRRAELATIEAEIESAHTVIDRYLTAFENGTTCAPRIATLEAKIIQLDARRTELTDLISTESTASGADVLDALRHRIRRVIATGAPAQRK